MVTRPDGSSINATFVTEPQLYFVIMRSRAARAREFRQWICNDVLPAIRKTGTYSIKQQLPDFEDPIKAAEAWIEAKKAERLALQQRDEAIRTKAEIGSRREATAMATASKEKRRADKLADQLGEGKNYRTVMSIQAILKPYLKINSVALQQVGKKLTKISKALGLDVRKVDHMKYGEVKAYNIRAVNELMNNLEANPDYLIKYRKSA